MPYYSVTPQAGADLQYTKEAWLWKFEGLVREGQGATFGAAVGGFEYTLYQVGETASDLGLLMEFLWDGRGAGAPVTPYDRDVFLGARLAFNDVQNLAILLGTVVDVNDGSMGTRLELERRLGTHFLLEVESQWFGNVDEQNPLVLFKQDSYLTVRFGWHF